MDISNTIRKIQNRNFMSSNPPNLKTNFLVYIQRNTCIIQIEFMILSLPHLVQPQLMKSQLLPEILVIGHRF